MKQTTPPPTETIDATIAKFRQQCDAVRKARTMRAKQTDAEAITPFRETDERFIYASR